VGDFWPLEEFGGFCAPGINDGFGFVKRELRNGQVVTRREADDFTDTGFGLRSEERVR